MGPELHLNKGSMSSFCSNIYRKEEENIQEEQFETDHKEYLGGLQIRNEGGELP